ncbi:MAG: UDP-N-acetylmuramate dehydrogenase [Acidimicrobiia bacterium]|nr:UDP-N-acetylmuramate dehydrogenase [Acidimicrobiia bacterium]MYE72509.1 UDP-N-acetylmuramate dehydrogenase [Acidimicrobiia bacterium]MYJ62661.1 UDP-N-acetylmuramate dehydrogenase [Acidimicrobiia bacterium]
MSSVDWNRLGQDLARVLGHEAVVRERPIGPETTYRVGGAARVGVTLAADADMAALAEVVAASGADVLVVGKGSNMLVADTGFDGVAVWLAPGCDWMEIDGLRVAAGAAASLPVLARQSAAAGLTGFEWAVGVPGSLGGAIRMNAGGHGSDMAASLIHAEVVDLRAGVVEVWDRPRLKLGYRSSALADYHLVLGAELGLAAGDAEESQALIADIVAWRRDNQPGGQNAGSVFTNPEGDSAGRIIDAAGLKELRLGSASVSDKHANFFIADRGGSADDLHALMGEVFSRVRAECGIALQPETRLVGFEAGPWTEGGG